MTVAVRADRRRVVPGAHADRVRRCWCCSGSSAPFFVYPVFVMNVLCMALFASAFNLLLGYTGLLSFGHAAFLGAAGYVTGQAVKAWGLPPELGDPAGTAVATVLGFVIGGAGHPAIRASTSR